MIFIGIDPGVHTGLAVYDRATRKLLLVEGMLAVEAEEFIRNETRAIHVYVEDTRTLRLPERLQSSGRLKGAGSVHRDMSRWEEFLQHHKVPHSMCGLSPKMFRQGDDEWFRRLTGWDKRTNEHGRAAAGLVWGK